MEKIRCKCGREARVVVSGAGTYIRCPFCGADTYICATKEEAIQMFREKYELPNTENTELLAFARYPDLEKAADRTAAKIKEGFLEMGYILKVARDTDILAGSGYENHEEFAEKRYGLDKGTVSRYIRIVERFSVGGNSHVLLENYRDIGFAKLSLMLHMPDAIADKITANYSKQEVQAIKEEIDAERAVSDIEIAIEQAEAAPEEKEGTMLEKAVRQLGREQKALYKKLWDAHVVLPSIRTARIMETLAPQGDAIHMVRIPGIGRLMLSISGETASVTNVRTHEDEKYQSSDVMAAVLKICHPGSIAFSYQQEYGEPIEEEAAVGACQAEKEQEIVPVPQKEKRKESKVTKAAPPKKPAPAASSVPEPQEEPLPGQQELTDYPDVVPAVQYQEITEPEVPAPAAGMEEDAGEKDETNPEKISGPEEIVKKNPGGSASAGSEEEGQLIWMEIGKRLDYLKQWATIWNYNSVPEDFLAGAYHESIGLAAALEKLMDLKGVSNV